MILRELLYKGPPHIAPCTAEVHEVPAGCYRNFHQIFYQKQIMFDKNYQKDNLWGRFLMVRTID